MRQHLSKYAWIVVPVALAVLAFSWFRFYRVIVPAEPNAYYYDLEAGELFVGDDQLASVSSPSGGEAVRAAVYACGQCGDKNEQFIAYLEKSSPEAIEQMNLPLAERTDPGAVDSGMWLSDPTTPPNWIPAASMQAQALRDAPYVKCGSQGSQAVKCIP